MPFEFFSGYLLVFSDYCACDLDLSFFLHFSVLAKGVVGFKNFADFLVVHL